MSHFTKHVKTLRDLHVIESLQEIHDSDQVMKLKEIIANDQVLPEGITFEMKSHTVWENGDYVTKKVPVFYEGQEITDADYEAMIKVESLKKLHQIEQHMHFFKILSIVLVTLYALFIIWSLTFN